MVTPPVGKTPIHNVGWARSRRDSLRDAYMTSAEAHFRLHGRRPVAIHAQVSHTTAGWERSLRVVDLALGGACLPRPSLRARVLEFLEGPRDAAGSVTL